MQSDNLGAILGVVCAVVGAIGAVVAAIITARCTKAKMASPVQVAAPRGNRRDVRTRMPAQFDAFLTHDWGTDEDGRDNHARVIKICHALRDRAGLSIWLDEDEMRGDVNQQMTDGIEDSACVVAFVTKRYIDKAGGKGPNGADDKCDRH